MIRALCVLLCSVAVASAEFTLQPVGCPRSATFYQVYIMDVYGNSGYYESIPLTEPFVVPFSAAEVGTVGVVLYTAEWATLGSWTNYFYDTRVANPLADGRALALATILASDVGAIGTVVDPYTVASEQSNSGGDPMATAGIWVLVGLVFSIALVGKIRP